MKTFTVVFLLALGITHGALTNDCSGALAHDQPEPSTDSENEEPTTTVLPSSTTLSHPETWSETARNALNKIDYKKVFNYSFWGAQTAAKAVPEEKMDKAIVLMMKFLKWPVNTLKAQANKARHDLEGFMVKAENMTVAKTFLEGIHNLTRKVYVDTKRLNKKIKWCIENPRKISEAFATMTPEQATAQVKSAIHSAKDRLADGTEEGIGTFRDIIAAADPDGDLQRLLVKYITKVNPEWKNTIINAQYYLTSGYKMFQAWLEDPEEDVEEVIAEVKIEEHPDEGKDEDDNDENIDAAADEYTSSGMYKA